MTRLDQLWGIEWAVVLSTLVFGLWHFGLAMSNTKGNILTTIASSIAKHDRAVVSDPLRPDA